ncbi:hypothetical protein HYH03_018561 [Edaphochlamys debaryana]|uniref:Uncharacterized protein n=1 Tax=Edaphochlamys debaryana TaxID=47281 RepID=A0A836BMU3_9CHLO|nr:hypothetical protein HYH03_018561 [Edaphochlamys debaryana]|eukprot:KAG2482516.1 hypothetical protein HYH03_018561 [Edaphochlamys debaryana]
MSALGGAGRLASDALKAGADAIISTALRRVVAQGAAQGLSSRALASSGSLPLAAHDSRCSCSACSSNSIPSTSASGSQRQHSTCSCSGGSCGRCAGAARLPASAPLSSASASSPSWAALGAWAGLVARCAAYARGPAASTPSEAGTSGGAGAGAAAGVGRRRRAEGAAGSGLRGFAPLGLQLAPAGAAGALLAARRLRVEPEPFEDEYDDDEWEDGEWVDLDLAGPEWAQGDDADDDVAVLLGELTDLDEVELGEGEFEEDEEADGGERRQG